MKDSGVSALISQSINDPRTNSLPFLIMMGFLCGENSVINIILINTDLPILKKKKLARALDTKVTQGC